VLSLPPPAQYWPFAACKTLLEERIGWVQEDALMLDDCDTVGGSLRYWSMVLILRLRFNTRTGFWNILSQQSNGTSLPRMGMEKSTEYHHSTCLATTDCTLPLSNVTQHPIFQDGRSAWSRPQRCQLAGGGTLPETQL
jgi:hypothetical protein